jgi:hypothetical protein
MLHLRTKQLRTPYALTKQSDVEPAWKSICPTEIPRYQGEKIPHDGFPFPIPISQPPQERRCDLHRRRKLSGFFYRSAASSLLRIWRGELHSSGFGAATSSGACTRSSSQAERRPLGRPRCSGQLDLLGSGAAQRDEPLQKMNNDLSTYRSSAAT